MSTTLETAIVIDTSQFIKMLGDAQTKATTTGKAINSALDVKPTGNADAFTASLKAAKDNAEKLKAELASVIATQGKSGAAYDDAVKKLKEATAEANKLESALTDAGNSISGNGSGFSALKDSFLQGQAGAGGLNSVLGGMAGTLGGLVNPIGAAVAGFGLLTAGISASIDIGKEFQTNLQAVSAVTGVSGAALDDIGNRAVDLSKKFGGSASQQLTVFQTTLSKIGPQLAQDSNALSTFADNVNVLSKTDSALGAAGAVDALTGAMLQFGVNVNDSNEVAKESGRFINVLAASAAVGSASVSDVAGAIAVVGGTAKNANVSFEETNAALQVLASKSLTGSMAGTALTAVINKLQAASGPAADQLVKMGTSSQELGQILTTKGIGAAMDKLRGAMTKLGSTSEKNAFLVGLFGETGLNAASALLQGGEQLADFTKGVTGTNAATEQARINMATFSEAMGRLKATLEAVGITVYKVIEPALSFLANTAANLLSGEGLNSSGFADAFRSIYKAVEPILNALYGLVKNTIVVAFNLIQTVWTSVVGSVESFAKQLGKIITPLGDDIRKLFGSFGDGAGIVDTIKAAFVVLGDVISGTLSIGLGIVGKGFEFLVSIIRGAVDLSTKFIGVISSLTGSVVNIAKQVIAWANSFTFVRNSIEVVVAIAQKLTGAISNLYGQVKNFLGLAEEQRAQEDLALEAAQKNSEAQSKITAEKQAQIDSTKKELYESQQLIGTYQDLSAKTKLNTQEKAQLAKAVETLSQRYPKLIAVNKSYADNADGVRRASELIANGLKETKKQSDELGKSLEKSNSELLRVTRNKAIEVAVQARIDDAELQKSFSTVGAQFKKEIYNAKTEDAINQAVNNAVQFINENAGKIGTAQADILRKAFKEAGVATAKYAGVVDDATSTTQANTQAVASNTDATKANEEAQKKRADELQKLVAAEKELINSRVKNNDLARQYELAINADTQLTESAAKLAKTKEEQQANVALLNTLLKQYSISGELAKLEPFRNFDIALTTEQIRGIEDIQLNVGANVDKDTKTKIRDEVQNLIRSLVEQRISEISITAEVDKAKILKAGNEIRAEFQNVGKFIGSETFGTDRDFETAKGLFEDLSKRIAEVRNKGNEASTKAERIAYAQLTKELKGEYEKLQKELTKVEDGSAKERLAARLASIKDDTDRELAEKTIALQQQRDKELANKFLTEDAKLNITIRYEEQIQALRDKAGKQSASTLESTFKAAYEGIAQSLSQINFADFNVKGFEVLRNKLSDSAKQADELPKALKAAKEEQQKLTQATLDGSIDMQSARVKLAEANQKVNELEQQQAGAKNQFLLQAEQAFYAQIATLAEQSFKQREQALQTYLAAEKTAANERELLKQREQATNEKIIAQEKVLAEAKRQLSTANTEANIAAVKQAETQLTLLNKQQTDYKAKLDGVLESERIASEQRSAAFDALAVSVGEQTVALIAAGDNFGSIIKKMAFDVASSLINIYTPSIIALFQSIIPPPFGLIAGGVAVASLKAILASLKGSFSEGGFTGGTSVNEVRGVVHGKEFVANAEITKREKPLLEYLHKGGSSFEYFNKNYSQTVVTNNGELLNVQAISQLQEINRRLEGVERGVRNMAVQYQSMQNVRMDVTIDEAVVVRNMSKNNRMRITRS